MKPFCFLLVAACAATLGAQQFKIELDQLSSKATNGVNLSLNGATLQLAARFLSSKDPDESKVKKLISSLDGIYIRTFEFKNPGEWSESDLDSIRKQLRGAEWSRLIGVKSGPNHTEEIYLRSENKKINGVAIIAAETRDLTVVNIVGAIDLDSLAELGGHLGIPKVDLDKQK
jgi:hypothetical protein